MSDDEDVPCLCARLLPFHRLPTASTSTSSSSSSSVQCSVLRRASGVPRAACAPGDVLCCGPGCARRSTQRILSDSGATRCFAPDSDSPSMTCGQVDRWTSGQVDAEVETFVRSPRSCHSSPSRPTPLRSAPARPRATIARSRLCTRSTLLLVSRCDVAPCVDRGLRLVAK